MIVGSYEWWRTVAPSLTREQIQEAYERHSQEQWEFMRGTRMKKDYTDITLLLDRSGSMESIQDDTIGGLRKFIEKQKGGPGKCHITLYQFDQHNGKSEVELVFSKDVESIRAEDVQLNPRGWTPLVDATGMTIKRVGEGFEAMPEVERPEKVIFVIITDGKENRSTEYTKEQVQAMVKHQEEAYHWAFVYMGANVNAFAEARQVGVASLNALDYGTSKEELTAAYGAMAENVMMARKGPGGQSVGRAMQWTPEQREATKKQS